MDSSFIALITTIISIFLLCWDIWQLSASKKDKEQKNSQVKIWHQSANGVSQSLFRICIDADQNSFSSVKDMKSAVWAVQANANSLYQSLYEERVVDEKEYKQEQKQIRDKLQKDFDKSQEKPI